MSKACAYTEVDCLADIYSQPLDLLSQFSFYYLSRITTITSLILIITHLYQKKLRQPPGDLIIGISASNLMLAIHWSIVHSYPSFRFGCGCFFNGILGVFGGFANFFYNLGFIIHMYQSMRHILKQGKMIQPKYYHWFSIGASAVGTLVLIINNNVGQTLFGTCSTKFDCNSNITRGFTTLFVYSLYQALAIYLYFYLKKKIDFSGKEKGELAFLNNYRLYLLITSVLWTFIAIAFAFNDFSSHEVGEPWGIFYHIFIPLGNFCKVFQAVILTIYRYREPYVKTGIKRMLFFWQKPRSTTDLEKNLLQNEENQEVMLKELDSKKSSHSEHMLEQISKRREIAFTCTILCSVLVAEKKKLHDDEPLDLTDIEREAKEKYTFFIDQNLVTRKLHYAEEELRRFKAKIIDTNVEVFAPKLFNSLRTKGRDGLPVDFLESFSLVLNKSKLLQDKGGDGGKSGEFFFFSADKKLVIKSISDYELETFMYILPGYYKHLNEHPNSLLARVYGVYKLEWGESDSLAIMIMENLCGYASEFVERRYDLKGSKYKRQVLSEEEYLDKAAIQSKTLKDEDFLKVEKVLKIPSQSRLKFLEVLDADSEFLSAAELIDYSLVVFMVNKGKYCESKGIGLEEEKYPEDFVSTLPSTELPAVYYKFGIIDFLQTYTVKKILEKNLKKIINMDRNLETSSQDPQYYKQRFQWFVRKILGLEVNASPREINDTRKNNDQSSLSNYKGKNLLEVK